MVQELKSSKERRNGRMYNERFKVDRRRLQRIEEVVKRLNITSWHDFLCLKIVAYILQLAFGLN